MLTFHIWMHDSTGPWRWHDGALTAGSSFIRPYAHPNLEQVVAVDGRRAAVAVREATTGANPARSGDCDAIIAQVRSWPLDHVLVEVTPGRVEITAGAHGVAPLYLAVGTDKALHGGWDLRDIVRAAADRDVDRLELMRLLTYWYRYTHQTVVRGVHQLTERATATFDHHGLRLAYPPAAAHSQPRTLPPGADPAAAFDGLLTATIDARQFAPQTAAVELSGGMDSSTVATALAKLHPGTILACAMLIPGPAGVQQRSRRTTMIEHLGLRGDTTVEAATVAPLHASGLRAGGGLVDPNESTFTEAQSALIATAAQQGIRTMFTGLGGDEMLSLRPGETDRALDWYRRHPPWLTTHGIDLLAAGEDTIAPASPVHEASLMSFASVAPLYLRHGVWPVSVLADPTLVRFGEWLPVQYRRRKQLFRDILTRAGLPTEVAYPPLRENLADVVTAGLLGGGLDLLEKIAVDSQLVDLGLVDGGALRATVAAARQAGNPQEADHQLFRVAVVELFLRALTG